MGTGDFPIIPGERINTMRDSDILLSLEFSYLEVGKDCDGKVYVQYKDSWVEDGVCLIGVCGRGSDFEQACTDYLKQIRGKTLVLGSGEDRKEVTVLG